MTLARAGTLDTGTWRLVFASWVLALAATLGALFIGEVMGQVPCNLCWFQRAFMFPLAIILGIGSLRADPDVWRYALPLAAVGWLIAAPHCLLYFEIVPKAIEPCGAGPSCSGPDMTLLGMPLPLLSLAAFSAIIALVATARRRLSK